MPLHAEANRPCPSPLNHNRAASCLPVVPAGAAVITCPEPAQNKHHVQPQCYCGAWEKNTCGLAGIIECDINHG